MRIQCSVYIATSLDGFIARKNGALDWLPGSDGAAGAEDYGYSAFFASVDALVMGRNTYELACTFTPWPYHGKRVIVLSHAYPATQLALGPGITGTCAAPTALLQQLADNGVKHVYVDGGKTIQSFLAAGLIDDITLTRVPVLIGEGIPLFAALPHDIPLKHLHTRAFDNGLVQSKYQRA